MKSNTVLANSPCNEEHDISRSQNFGVTGRPHSLQIETGSVDDGPRQKQETSKMRHENHWRLSHPPPRIEEHEESRLGSTEATAKYDPVDEEETQETDKTIPQGSFLDPGDLHSPDPFTKIDQKHEEKFDLIFFKQYSEGAFEVRGPHPGTGIQPDAGMIQDRSIQEKV